MKELLALLAGLAVLALAYWHIRPQVMEQDKPYLWTPKTLKQYLEEL